MRDLATESLQATELNDLDLFTVTAAARSAVEKVRLRAGRRVAVGTPELRERPAETSP